MASDDIEAYVQEITELSGRLHSRTRANYEAKIAEAGLNAPQARAVMALGDEPMSMRALSDLLDANPSNITITVARLEGRGLVERASLAGDRRVRAVHLTEEGKMLQKRLQEGLYVGNPVTKLTDWERRILRDLLRRLVDER